MVIDQPASYDAGISGKPLGGFPPNPLSLVLTEGVRESHRVAPMMPKGEAFELASVYFVLLFKISQHFLCKYILLCTVSTFGIREATL